MKHKSKCCVKGCGRPIGCVKHSLCQAHYLRLIRTGEVGSPRIRKKRVIPSYIS